MNAPLPASRVAGVVPWLPWPLSAWRWWTVPVRAERLAALRIGLAFCLLLDILLTYLQGMTTFFGRGALGDPSVHSWLADAPRLSWSVLRGVGDPLLSFLAVLVWIGTSTWIVIDLGTRMLRGNGPRERDPLRYSVPLWCLSGAVAVLGIWSRLAAHDELTSAWLVPLITSAAAIVFVALELLRCLLHGAPIERRMLLLLGVACGCGIVLLALGVYLSVGDSLTPGSVGARLLGPWQDDPALLYSAMIAWIIATVCLLLGFCTRPAAIATWVLSLSFANLNDSIDNAGDTIRGIILFYLMLCPCGAVWSIDRLWRRWRGHDTAVVYVAPWAIRLLFVQMVFIYFCNGVYKLFGEHWRDGYSLYYVLSDFTLSRFSMADYPSPLWMLRVMTWSVLAWEISFPLMVVLNRWTRLVALIFGVLFHLGIGVTMELGFFVPYALCLYLPLVPWELVSNHAKKT
jgi:uncharacterized membrane protein YphA (DoxX/SURF4 family)